MAIKLNTISVTVTVPNVRVNSGGGNALKPITFYTTDSVTAYQGADSLGIGYVSALSRLNGRAKANIDSVQRQSNNITPDKYDYSDEDGFSFLGDSQIKGNEYIVINFH